MDCKTQQDWICQSPDWYWDAEYIGEWEVWWTCVRLLKSLGAEYEQPPTDEMQRAATSEWIARQVVSGNMQFETY